MNKVEKSEHVASGSMKNVVNLIYERAQARHSMDQLDQNLFTHSLGGKSIEVSVFQSNCHISHSVLQIVFGLASMKHERSTNETVRKDPIGWNVN